MAWIIDVALLLHPAPAGSTRVSPSEGSQLRSSSSFTYHYHPYYMHGLASSPNPEGDRIRPPLAPFVFSADAVLPQLENSQSHHDVPMNIYRSRRLRRALGALPSTQILPPGRSIPAPPTASPHRRGGQYRGDFGMITWNAQALFAGDAIRRQAKMRYLHSLVARADVILITEAHGTGGDHAAWRPPQGPSW